VLLAAGRRGVAAASSRAFVSGWPVGDIGLS